jgi:hypothetical protein
MVSLLRTPGSSRRYVGDGGHGDVVDISRVGYDHVLSEHTGILPSMGTTAATLCFVATIAKLCTASASSTSPPDDSHSRIPMKLLFEATPSAQGWRR